MEISQNKLLIYIFSNEKNPPLLVYIHGGYWAIDKNDHSFVTLPYLKQGIAVSNLNYDLCPSVTLDEIVNEIVEAFQFIKNKSYDWQTSGIFLIGHPAGAHLAELLGRPFFDKRQRDQKSKELFYFLESMSLKLF